MIRVLVADDHAVVRKGLAHILSELDCAVLIEEASTGKEVLRLGQEQGYDLILLDIALPDMNGLEVLKQLHATRPNMPILMLSIYPERQYATRALRAGAAGYLTKDSAPSELLTAVKRILAGHKYISPALAELLADDLISDASDEPHRSLSDRELQVLCLLGEGRTVSEIAAYLGLSVKTISTYRSRILQKLRLSTTAELIQYAVRHELVA